jgi:hypothetical protein
MRYGLPDERLGLRHLASMLGCTVWQVNETADNTGDCPAASCLTDLTQVCHQILEGP